MCLSLAQPIRNRLQLNCPGRTAQPLSDPCLHNLTMSVPQHPFLRCASFTKAFLPVRACWFRSDRPRSLSANFQHCLVRQTHSASVLNCACGYELLMGFVLFSARSTDVDLIYKSASCVHTRTSVIDAASVHPQSLIAAVNSARRISSARATPHSPPAASP